jgi:hypothetical protein
MLDPLIAAILAISMIIVAFRGEGLSTIKIREGRYVLSDVLEATSWQDSTTSDQRVKVTTTDSFILRTIAALAWLPIHDAPSPASVTTESDVSTQRQDGSDRELRDFSDHNLAGSNFAGVNLGGYIFANSDMRQAQLGRANLSGAVFSGANLAQADLTRALAMSTLFINANLTDAILTSANISGADLGGATLSGAILDGVTWSSTTTWPIGISDDVRRRSVQIAEDAWQIRPEGTQDRVFA